jgi:hypothetical protein
MISDGYPWYLVDQAGRSNATVLDSVPGTPGTGVDQLISDLMPQLLSVQAGTVADVSMNWGVNEMTPGDNPASLPNETTWTNGYKAIIDYVQTLWPGSRVFLTYPWRAGYSAQPAELHSRIDDVIAWCAGEGYACFPGVDEAVTIEGGDNGATATLDGVHYSAAGNVIYAEALKAAMGY